MKTPCAMPASGTRASDMARALLLGGAGFIGAHLAARLLDDGHAVTILDDLSRGRRDAELQALTARGTTLVEGDLTRADVLDGLSRDWDQIYLLAAVVGVRNVERDPARVLRVNGLSVLHVLDWLPGRGETLFFASTSETYAAGVSAGAVPVPTPETVPLSVPDSAAPRFAYAASKIFGEAAVLHGTRAKGVRCVVGRFHNVYGPRMGADHVIPELSLRALNGENPFRVYGATQRRAFCHVADAVDAMTRLMATPAADRQVVNIGNDAEETVVEDLVALVLRVAGVSPRLERLPAPPGSVERRCPDISRLRSLTGFVPKITLEAGVAETFAWYRDRWPRPGRT
jgi:UDP-glucuronate decarboxylase